MDIEKLIEKAKAIGYDEVPFSREENESAVGLIFTAYQKPLDKDFLRSLLYQADIKIPNLNNTLHMMKRTGKIKHVGRGVYQTTSTEPTIVSSRVQKKLFDRIGVMFALKKEISQREDDIEKLQNKVDDLRSEKQKLKQS